MCIRDRIPTIYYKNSSLEKAMDYLFIEVDRAIRDGANILILSDRDVYKRQIYVRETV